MRLLKPTLFSLDANKHYGAAQKDRMKYSSQDSPPGTLQRTPNSAGILRPKLSWLAFIISEIYF